MRQLLVAIPLVLMLPLAAPAQAPPGFSTYLLGLMTRGEGPPPPGTTAADLQKAHLANLTAMWKEGLLLGSGPIGDKGELRGALIFAADARPAIERRVNDDPLLKAGLLKIALMPWMGPEGIGVEYKKWAAANPGRPDKMRTYQLILMKPVAGAPPMTPGEQRAHVDNMNAMAAAGKLAVAGPVLEPNGIEGVFVFIANAAEADRLAASDPAVTSGKLTPERHPWMVAEGVLPHGFRVP